MTLKDKPIENKEVLFENLINQRDKDLVSGRTNYGPHADDLQGFYLEKGIDVKYCSTGEQKAFYYFHYFIECKIDQRKAECVSYLDFR